jgi:uncharacterized protein YqeY
MELKLREQIKIAMRVKSESGTPKNCAIYQTRKNILEQAQKIAKEKKIEITDSLIYDAAKKEIKQLNDLMQFCTDKPEKQNIINISINEANNWLPSMTSEDDIKTFVETHKSDANNIGTMMKLLKSEFGDSLDGKLASQIVKSLL